MNVVVEGIDNSGKSTLIKFLTAGFPDWSVQPSEGPPKYEGEVDVRIERYALMPHTIFDRHPVVSQTIYRTIRSGHDAAGMRDELVQQFYDSRPFFIYCDPVGRGMAGHTFNDGVDTEDHLRQVREGYDKMLTLYRAWAIQHAHLIYRIGDSMSFIADCVERAIYRNGSNT
jgi:hypothetical protein